jgi:hypothetical protein
MRFTIVVGGFLAAIAVALPQVDLEKKIQSRNPAVIGYFTTTVVLPKPVGGILIMGIVKHMVVVLALWTKVVVALVIVP